MKLSTLTEAEKQEFQKAKMAEVQNWIKAGLSLESFETTFLMTKSCDVDGC